MNKLSMEIIANLNRIIYGNITDLNNMYHELMVYNMSIAKAAIEEKNEAANISFWFQAQLAEAKVYAIDPGREVVTDPIEFLDEYIFSSDVNLTNWIKSDPKDLIMSITGNSAEPYLDLHKIVMRASDAFKNFENTL